MLQGFKIFVRNQIIPYYNMHTYNEFSVFHAYFNFFTCPLIFLAVWICRSASSSFLTKVKQTEGTRASLWKSPTAPFCSNSVVETSKLWYRWESDPKIQDRECWLCYGFTCRSSAESPMSLPISGVRVMMSRDTSLDCQLVEHVCQLAFWLVDPVFLTESGSTEGSILVM